MPENVYLREVRWGYKPWRMAVLLGHIGRLPFNRLVPTLNYSTARNICFAPAGRPHCALTVHDLIFKLFPSHHKRLNHWYLNRAIPLWRERASAIIAVSEATKRDPSSSTTSIRQ